MEELFIKNLPSWAMGIGFLLMVAREIIFLFKDTNPMFYALKRYQEVYDTLDMLQEQTGANRVTILKAHDSGHVMTPETKLYSSVLFSTANGELRGVSKKWQEQPLDFAYVNLLMNLAGKKQVRVLTKDLEEGILKSLYINDGVEVSYLAEIKQIKKRRSFFKSIIKRDDILEYVYISVNFKKEVADFPNIMEDVRATATAIRSIMKKE